VTLQHAEYLDTPTLTRTVADADRLGQMALQERHVERVVHRIIGPAMLSTAGESFGAGFIAFDPEAEDRTTLSVIDGLVEGELFASGEDRGIIVGQRLVKNLGIEMGDKIVYTMTDRRGEIVSGLARLSGIVRTGAPSVDGALCLLPIDAVREVVGYAPDEAIQVAVFINDNRRSDLVAEHLRRRVGEGIAVVPWHRNQPELAAFIALKVGGARFMEILIAVLVAAGIFNTLFVSVMERLREFGIMMAIGFSPGRLFRLVMLESLWLGLLGLLAAAVVTAGPYRYMAATGIDVSALLKDQSLEVSGVAMATTLKVGIFPENLVLIAVAALIATLLSGLYPAWKAGRVEPVETIKLV
jgi:ABC-type lipoprotein release transport system permease subunit